MTPWSRFSRFTLIFTGAIAIPFSASATCHHPKCSADLNTAASSTVPVIVQYTVDPSETEVASLKAFASVTHHIHSIRAVAAKVSATDLEALANRPGVAYVSLDRKVAVSQTVAPIGTSPEFTAEPINANWANAKGYTGKGIGVAVIDSGISPVDDLAGRVVYSQNFVPNETLTTDGYGHGTHVAGLIAGSGKDSTGAGFTRTFTGIAPGANLINLRALDETGLGSDSAVIAAIDQAIALKAKYNIKVINLSLGRPIYESYTLDPLCQAVEQAWAAGITVVVAAGNDGRNNALNNEGYGTINAPGNDPYAITIGATNPMNTATVNDDEMASYSSKGPSLFDQVVKPDIIAPGNLVTSLLAPGSSLQPANPTFYTPLAWYVANGSQKASTTYFPLSGTSMSTAVASGAIADLLQADSALTPDQAKALLMYSANKNVIPQTYVISDGGNTYTEHNDIFTVGAGYLDLEKTIQNAQSYGRLIPAGAPALSPVAVYVPGSNQVGIAISKTALWGNTALWGYSNLQAYTALWGATALWGNSAFDSSSTALWGATALWGNTALWGYNNPSAYTAVSGATALWGYSDPQAYTALWGRTALWGSGSPSAATALWGNTALWGYSTDGSNTALWGRTALWGW